MDYFRSTFFKFCREHYSKYGFKRKGQVYVRVNKEIIQNLSFSDLCPEGGAEYSFERLKEFFDELVHYGLVMKMIENNDIESINEMLRKNEENCISNLGNLIKQ